MRALALSLALLGIALLLAMLEFLPATSISSEQELNATLQNAPVSTAGKVIKERSFGAQTLLVLNNSIKIVCDCPSLLNKTIIVKGKTDTFLFPKIKALELRLYD